MMGAAKAHYDCIKVLSETEFYDDLSIIDVPVLVMHGEDDQICPFPTTGARSVKLLKNGTTKILSWAAAWDADNAQRHYQLRPSRIYPILGKSPFSIGEHLQLRDRRGWNANV